MALDIDRNNIIKILCWLIGIYVCLGTFSSSLERYLSFKSKMEITEIEDGKIQF